MGLHVTFVGLSWELLDGGFIGPFVGLIFHLWAFYGTCLMGRSLDLSWDLFHMGLLWDLFDGALMGPFVGLISYGTCMGLI